MLHLVEHETSAWFGSNCETKAKMILVEVGCKWNGKVSIDLSELLHPPHDWKQREKKELVYTQLFSPFSI